MNWTIKAAVLASACGLIALPGAAMAQSTDGASQPAAIPGSFRLSTGVTYSSGDYGEIEDTRVLAIPLSLTYRQEGFKIRVSVPYVFIDGPGSLIQTPEGRDSGSSNSGSDNSGSGSSNSGSGSSGSSGSGSSGSSSGGSEVEVEDGSLTGTNNSRNGIGDVSIFANYSFELGDSTFFEPGVKLKLPTASRTDRLGTGEVDVTLSADLVQEVGPATFYVHGRRKFAGRPEGSTIRSTWGAGGGVSLSASDGVYVGADYDWQQSAFAGRTGSSEVSGWVNFRLARGLSMTAYAGTGLNANSADLFGGATVSVRF